VPRKGFGCHLQAGAVSAGRAVGLGRPAQRVCREQQGKGENGLVGSRSGCASNRFWMYKVD